MIGDDLIDGLRTNEYSIYEGTIGGASGPAQTHPTLPGSAAGRADDLSFTPGRSYTRRRRTARKKKRKTTNSQETKTNPPPTPYKKNERN